MDHFQLYFPLFTPHHLLFFSLQAKIPIPTVSTTPVGSSNPVLTSIGRSHNRVPGAAVRAGTRIGTVTKTQLIAGVGTLMVRQTRGPCKGTTPSPTTDTTPKARRPGRAITDRATTTGRATKGPGRRQPPGGRWAGAAPAPRRNVGWGGSVSTQAVAVMATTIPSRTPGKYAVDS